MLRCFNVTTFPHLPLLLANTTVRTLENVHKQSANGTEAAKLERVTENIGGDKRGPTIPNHGCRRTHKIPSNSLQTLCNGPTSPRRTTPSILSGQHIQPSPMSAYKGHRGVNVSQYVQQLNQLSPPQGLLDEPVQSEDDFSAFLNTEFFDINNAPIAGFDPSLDLDAGIAPTTTVQSQPKLGNTSRKHSLHASAEPNMEFNLNGKPCRRAFPCSYDGVFCTSLPSAWPQRSLIVCSSSANGEGPRRMQTPPLCFACSHHPHTSCTGQSDGATKLQPCI